MRRWTFFFEKDQFSVDVFCDEDDEKIRSTVRFEGEPIVLCTGVKDFFMNPKELRLVTRDKFDEEKVTQSDESPAGTVE